MTDNSATTATSTADTAPKRSALHDEHVRLAAEMRNVGGYEVPFRYTDEVAEHNAVREAVGLFDLSLMGIIRVTGDEAASFLAHTMISAIKPLALGRAKYTMIVQEDGGIIDDLIIYRLGSQEFMLVQNAANYEVVYTTLQERVGGYDVQVERMNDRTSLLAIQGPKSAELLRKLLPNDQHATLDGLNHYSCTVLDVAGEEMIVARTGYTGEDGFEVFAPSGAATHIWRSLLEQGQGSASDAVDMGLLPCGLACRDTLRLEAGMPLYGYELTRSRTPLEAGFQSIIGPTKGRFIGRNALINRPQTKELLVGLRISGNVAAARGSALLDAEGTKVGEITSSKVTPTLGQPIAFAYVQRWSASTGTEFTIEGTEQTATVVPTPFYKRPRN